MYADDFLTHSEVLSATISEIQRVRGRLSPPPLPPPVPYEEVGVAREVKRSQDIQLTSNEAYGPILKDNIQTSPNTAYGQVHL